MRAQDTCSRRNIVALCESSCQYGSLKRSLKHRDMQEGQEHAQDEERRQRVSLKV